MRSYRPVSIPLSLLVTGCFWFGFLWAMQQAPSSRRQNADDFSGSRSSGGLANQFASKVVKFFDNQDPREISEESPAPDPVFEGQMVELMPLPPHNREELAADLPEVYRNPSLSSQDLFRSDVDLDGDNDLDMALLLRLSKNDAMGAVLEYVGDDRFRYAGKFHCETPSAGDFNRCFQILRSGGGKMHVLSRMPNVLVANPDHPDPANRLPEDTFREVPPIPGWRILRLEDGALVEKTRVRDLVCPGAGGVAARRVAQPATDVRPVGETESDLLRFTTACAEEPSCRVLRYDSETGLYVPMGDASPSFCEQQAPTSAGD